MATYTSADELDLASIAKRYGFDDISLEPLNGGAANSSFKAGCEQGEFVLTVLDNHDQRSAEILAAHTRALFERGMPTAEVVSNIDGDDISLVDGRCMLLKRWIPGQVVEPLPHDLLEKAGRLLAQLHGLRPDVPNLPVGTRRLSTVQVALVDGFPDHAFAQWLTKHLDAVQRREAHLTQVPDVISHGDLFTDNLLVKPDGELAIIDWETVSLDSALLDLGMTLLGLAKVDGRLDQEAAGRILHGYDAVRPLSPEHADAVRSEVEHAALIIAFHRYYRHNIRFPDAAKSRIHEELIGFVQSLDSFDARIVLRGERR